ncbi:cilia- and flagella-associated protein 107 [Betta splendens]|uniref:Cilia- and flagella-associated protein 107 n=1 Tax=Betta splendens TaxID=158456 RepID=A0A6P7MHL8_BETSP|nr:cilia- and flagella-associated protein 107 [Betta splendens]
MNQDKWAQPGWRIEQKYASKVLLGNWAEDRLQFSREPRAASSTNRADYRPHWDFKPDTSERRSALLRAEGLPSKLLFAHGGAPSTRRLMTHYEQSFGPNRTSALPNLRCWRPDSSARQPERSHRPTSALPAVHEPPQSTEQRPPAPSVYRSEYQRHPLSAFCRRRAARAPRERSSHLHAANRDNKDLGLRWGPMLQVPDPCLGPAR